MTAGIVGNYTKRHRNLGDAILANAINVYNGGGLALPKAGAHIGQKYKTVIQIGYSKAGTGKKYIHPTKGEVRASVPPAPPAMQEGELRDSVEFSVAVRPGRSVKTGRFVKGFGKTVVHVFTRHEAALRLERGYMTPQGAQVPPRPHWREQRRNPQNLTMIRSITARFFLAGERAMAAKLRTQMPKKTYATIGREVRAGR